MPYIKIANKTPIECLMSVKYRFRHYSAFILDAILNLSICSMMTEWHHLDSSKAMPDTWDSGKKKKEVSSCPGPDV